MACMKANSLFLETNFGEMMVPTGHPHKEKPTLRILMTTPSPEEDGRTSKEPALTSAIV